ncbi:MAG: TRAP transporter TatT component family protein, partial [Proteobacteria bacterium]|nr:TRAP transporter TatT component family protein [Pseudomonadota bacterium]
MSPHTYPPASHKFTINIILLILLIASLNTPVCFSQTASPVSPGIDKCNELARNRTDMVKYREAITCYEQSFAAAPREDTAVRLGKSYYWLGSHSAENVQTELFQKGIDWSKKAIALNPKGAGGHFWLGVNDGKYGESRGILKSLFLVGPIKEEMQQVIAIDPAYEHGGAYRVLGRMFYKLPGFAGGGVDKSITNLKKSLEYAPNVSTTHVFLAESYIKQKDYQGAKNELNFVM